MAQNLSFGADNFYRSNNVTLTPISFLTLYHSKIAGNIFVPHDLNRTDAPAIIVGHPFGATKEQSANLYAQKLAEQGFVTVSLDLPFWGISEGTPRNAVLPDLYAEAYSAAVDFLGTQEFVDRGNIGIAGVCGSGAFVISAAKIDSRIKAVATVSMYNHGMLHRNGLGNSRNLTQRQDFIAAANAQRWAEVDGSPIAHTDGAPHTTTSTPIGNVKFINFYPFEDIESISPRPMMFVAGDQAHSKEFSEIAFARAGEPKEMVWVPNAGHVDLYDRVELIPFATLTKFFKENLQ
ncbi:hypothetical protein AG0111_0g12626 [Alternaria gaisen]|uniref:Uncharacterized protein n=1 Tax=Alternaria gaisen TaxID=167740 RepID=A0ACB6F3Z8_9PLEO|nr:hypothetical protein AG0111_0g12626 [Alternaria gaisen]